MGGCADDIATPLTVNEETASYRDVRAALTSRHDATVTIVERVRSNTRKQTPEEPVATLPLFKFCIAEDFKHGILKNQLIRDRIVVGVLDDTLSARLQAKPYLALVDAVRMSRKPEARKQTEPFSFRGEDKPCDVEIPSDVDYVNPSRSSNGKSDRRQTSSPRNQTKRASASGALVRATNGDFVQPKMLPAAIATKWGVISLSVAATNATQTWYME